MFGELQEYLFSTLIHLESRRHSARLVVYDMANFTANNAVFHHLLKRHQMKIVGLFKNDRLDRKAAGIAFNCLAEYR